MEAQCNTPTVGKKIDPSHAVYHWSNDTGPLPLIIEPCAFGLLADEIREKRRDCIYLSI